MTASLLASVMASCTGRTLEDEWQYTLELAQSQTLQVMDYLPRSDTPGVPRHIEPYFFFNKQLDLDDLSFAMEELGADRALDFDPLEDFDGLGLRFVPDEDITPQTQGAQMDMDLSLGLLPLVTDSPFELRLPTGRYYNASTELECTRFGSNPSHAKQLNNYMEPGVYPLYVLFAEGIDASTTFPTTLDLYVGPAYVRENGQLRIFRHLGFTTPLPQTEIAADGSFRVEEDGGFLPLDTPEGVLLLYLDRMVVTGRFTEGSGAPEMTDFSMSGVIPTRFLRILANSSSAYNIVVSMLDLDADLNHNGSPDSATFAVRSHPTLLQADEYSP